MTSLAITRRPVVLATSASAAMLTDILARIASIRGRTSAWGVVNDATRAELLASTSTEAVFLADYYRQGFVTAATPTLLPSWTFSRTGAATADNASGEVENFATGAPRITTRGLLVEAAATNLFLHSNDISHAAWTPEAGAVITGTAEWNGVGDFYQIVTTAASTRYCAAMDVVPLAATTVKIRMLALPGFAEIGVAVFNLTAGTVTSTGGTGATSGVLQTADGWRPFLTATTASDTTSVLVAIVDGDGPMEISALQFETGPRPSSRIATTSSTATRGADVATFAHAASTEGGALIEFLVPRVGVSSEVRTIFAWDNGSSAHAASFYLHLGNLYVSVALPGSSYQTSVAQTASGTRMKVFVGWADGQIVCAISGSARPSGTYTLDPAMTTVRPGGTYYSADALNGFIERVTLFDALPSVSERLAMTGA